MPKRGKEDAMTQRTADRARDELADRRGRRYPVDIGAKRRVTWKIPASFL